MSGEDVKKEDGGPAFPKSAAFGMSGDFDGSNEGMSLRDWFAGKALRLLVTEGRTINPNMTAQSAYELADAMIKERSHAR